VTHFEHDNEAILAVAWREQGGTTHAISLPRCVIEYAKQRSVEDFYLSDERTAERKMFTCKLSQFEKGWLQKDDERYVPLSALTEVPWRRWQYAERVVYLQQEKQRSDAQQLELFAGVGL